MVRSLQLPFKLLLFSLLAELPLQVPISFTKTFVAFSLYEASFTVLLHHSGLRLNAAVGVASLRVLHAMRRRAGTTTTPTATLRRGPRGHDCARTIAHMMDGYRGERSSTA